MKNLKHTQNTAYARVSRKWAKSSWSIKVKSVKYIPTHTLSSTHFCWSQIYWNFRNAHQGSVTSEYEYLNHEIIYGEGNCYRFKHRMHQLLQNFHRSLAIGIATSPDSLEWTLKRELIATSAMFTEKMSLVYFVTASSSVHQIIICFVPVGFDKTCFSTLQ